MRGGRFSSAVWPFYERNFDNLAVPFNSNSTTNAWQPGRFRLRTFAYDAPACGPYGYSTKVAAKAGTVSFGKDRSVPIQKFEAFEKDRNFWKGMQLPLWPRPLYV